ncbi:MAG: MDR/SDR family oxidoreductase, partial [Pseudomonadota bacterium]
MSQHVRILPFFIPHHPTTIRRFAPACHASHVLARGDAVCPLPEGLDAEAAGATGAVFLTALYALCEMARIEPGESVLIHGGAGGVGLAALQVARAAGARVIATAGSPAKRELLTALGAQHVADSRSLAFAEDVMAVTDGRGVDVVLNALPGAAMQRSTECLAPFGRFVELGKRDYAEAGVMGLRPFRRNCSYFGVDLDHLLVGRPAIARRLMRELADRLAAGDYLPIFRQGFEAEDVADAFRLMQSGRHIGKIVLRPPRPGAGPVVAGAPAIRDGWLISGGLGGFGLATAAWLLERGARTLWLAGRRGTPRAEDAPALDALRDFAARAGATVHCLALDITDRAAVAAAVAEVAAGAAEAGTPLRGIVHAAAVLDDAPLRDLDRGRIDAILAPKIAGAEALDQASRTLDLDHFLLFSSIAGWLGNIGQAPYAAANGALEGLARARVAAGLPALAVAFGPIADAGMLARDERTRGLLEKRLGRLMGATEALERMGTAMGARQADPVVAVGAVPWARLAGDLAVLQSPVFERVDNAGDGAAEDGPVTDLATRIREAATPAAALDAAAAILGAEIAALLRLPADAIERTRPLADLGIDSREAGEQFGFIPRFEVAGSDRCHVVALAVKTDPDDLDDFVAQLE